MSSKQEIHEGLQTLVNQAFSYAGLSLLRLSAGYSAGAALAA